MPKKCMPGVICIESATITILLLMIVCGVLLLNYYNKNYNTNNTVREKIYVNNNNNDVTPPTTSSGNIGFFPRFNFGFSNTPNDVLLNPYQAPLRDDSYFPGRSGGDIRNGVPINISTQSVDTTYRQIGILTRMNGEEMILPLMGRPLFTNRDKWNFYTMSDKNNMVKLPITNKGKSCTDEYGCDNLYNGDSVYVEGYNDSFKVTVYDNQIMRYIPFL
jgi:hypothetical protein